MLKILITGFEPFDKFKENPSQKIVESLKENDNLHTVVLPVSFEKSFPILLEKIESYKPEVVICLGVAGKREKVSLERVAINWIESKIQDNDGRKDHPQKIDVNGESAYFSTLPLYDLLSLSEDLEISNTAGTYVCNHLMYELLKHTKQTHIQAGFIHVPPDFQKGFEAVSKILEFNFLKKNSHTL